MRTIILLTLFSLSVLAIVQGQKAENLKVLDSLLKNYDRRAVPTSSSGEFSQIWIFLHFITPFLFSGAPAQVDCGLYIKSFGSVSEKTMVNFAFYALLQKHVGFLRLGESYLMDESLKSKTNLKIRISLSIREEVRER